MKNRTINIIAFIILISLFLGGIYNGWSWFSLQNKIERTYQEAEVRDRQGKEYVKKIKAIYNLAKTEVNLSFDLIEKTRKLHPKKESDLDYVEARILIINNQKEKAEFLLEKFKRNSKFKTPKFYEIYAYLQIEKGEIDVAEKCLINASQINSDYKYQLANLYEIRSEFEKAIELYDQIIAKGSTNKILASKRKMLLKNQTLNEITNIELNDDSNRKYFSIGIPNIN